MADWSLLHFRSPLNTVAPGSGQYGELTLASSRKLAFVSTDAGTLTFEMPAARQAAAIVPLVDDVLATRDDDVVQRFRVVARELIIEGGARRLSFTAVTYRALLDAWIMHDADQRSWTASTEQTAIAWAIIQQGQTRAGGNLGISRGVLPAIAVNRILVGSLGDGGTRPAYLTAGMKRSEAINAVAALSNGFEWDITPSLSDPYRRLSFDCWNAGDRNQHAVRSPLQVDMSTVVTFRHAIAPTDYGNVLRFTGAEQTDSNGGAATTIKPVWQPGGGNTTANPAGSPVEGRWERDVNNGDLTTQAAVVAAAPAAYDAAHLYVPEISCTLRRGVWQGRTHLWLGDLTRVLVTELVDGGSADSDDDYLLFIDEDVRVVELTVDVDDQGAEDVALGLGRRSLTTKTNTRVVNDRLKRLERR